MIRLALAGAAALFSLAMTSGAVLAADAPRVGPVPAWVLKTPDLPTEKDDLKGLPLFILLNNTQFSFDAEGWTEFHEIEARVQTAVGLQALGTIPFQWSPWSDTLTFHRAVILRDGQSISVLPAEGEFTVLRRETGLDRAMLTGELTALLQPEGIQVGDTIDIALSIRHADPLLKGQAVALFTGWDASPLGRLRLEAHWPSNLGMRWRATSGLPPLRRSDAGGVTSVSLDMDDVRPLVLPAHAPPRYQHGREVEFSTVPDWKDVAQAMAPLFAKAARLSPQSPVVAQAAQIAATSTDPKVRAGAALRLVQTQVRYLAHSEASGGYTPQTADDTWRLRYGDCKAKTALLMALLRELGVPAEPVLASTIAGDRLADGLPGLASFNHVLVRVSLGGKDYWLDGARQGDRDLDSLEIPDFGWVLPLGPSGGKIIHIQPAVASRPQIEQIIRYDASAGVTAPEGTTLKTVFRGDGALALHNELASVPPERMDAALKAYWSTVHSAFTPAHLAQSWDPASGEEILTADGTSKLDWSGSGLELQHVEFGGAPDIKRDPAAVDPDAPYAVGFPAYVQTDESVVLPPGDTPSAESAKTVDVDTVIAGVAYHRSGSIDGHVFRVVASQRALQPEITAVEARASVDPLTKLGKDGVYAPAGSASQEADAAAAVDSQPTTADGHVRRGEALANKTRFQEAIAEFDAAIALDPKSQLAWADRAVAKAWLRDPGAPADADKANSLGPPSVIVARAHGVMALNRGDFEGARSAFRQALTIAPGDPFSLEKIIELDLQHGDTTAARAELADMIKVHPELAGGAHLFRALIEFAAHNHTAAEQELALAPAETSFQLFDRARAYRMNGDLELARKDIDAAIRLEPSAELYLMRASMERAGDPAAADADIDSAVKLAPDNLEARTVQVNAAIGRGDYVAALPLIDSLLKDQPQLADSYYVSRAKIEGKLGLKAEMDADFLLAQASAGSDAFKLDTLCEATTRAKWRPATALAICDKVLESSPKSTSARFNKALLLHRLGRDSEAEPLFAAAETTTTDPTALNSIRYYLAVEGIRLEKALADCDFSLNRRPKDPPTLDSRAFVLLRLGRNREALAAYNAALAGNPHEFNSLYGRGLIEARLGLNADSARDLAAARTLHASVATEFEAMGVH